MGGKALIYVVLGFSVILLVIGVNHNKLTTDAVDNSSTYFENEVSHNIAVSAANMALNKIFIDSDWRDGFSNISILEGTANVTVTDIGTNLAEVVSVGTFEGVSQTIKVQLQPSSFSKFAWYVGNMSSKEWISGDTVWGPFHSQSQLNIGGDPVFFGKVTSLKGISPDINQLKAKGLDPKFYGGYNSGVDIPLPDVKNYADQKATALDGVVNKGGSSYFGDIDLNLIFNNDGTVTYRTGPSSAGGDTSQYSAPVTEDLSTFAPNGVVYVEKGDIYTQGTLKGNVTIVAGESSGSGHGNVYLTDDLVYSQDPMTWDAAEGTYVEDNSVTDMLGILATNNVRVVDNDNNNKDKDIHIDATIFCLQGGFEMQNKNMPPSGSLYLRGGMIAAKEELIATTDNNGIIKNGYKKHVVFDRRLLLQSPVNFPNTGKFEIVSWYE